MLVHSCPQNLCTNKITKNRHSTTVFHEKYIYTRPDRSKTRIQTTSTLSENKPHSSIFVLTADCGHTSEEKSNTNIIKYRINDNWSILSVSVCSYIITVLVAYMERILIHQRRLSHPEMTHKQEEHSSYH